MNDLPSEAFLDNDNAESEVDVILGTLDINFESNMAIGEKRQCTMLSKSMETTHKIDKWTGVGNFALWSCEMRDKLTTQGQARSLLDERLESMREDEWVDLCFQIWNEIWLYLGDEIHIQVLWLTTFTRIMEVLSEALFEHFHIIEDACESQALILHDEGQRRPIDACIEIYILEL
ncbi:hypothetical protein R1flu_016407 [Riccia fluitans]|uniref:Uncharacterized protein n=1 Tax=Riccia fluitans TaxID=41844 RepID=A0ABD1YLS6_9MARC